MNTLMTSGCAGGLQAMPEYSPQSWPWKITLAAAPATLESPCYPTTRPGGLSLSSRCSSPACSARLMPP